MWRAWWVNGAKKVARHFLFDRICCNYTLFSREFKLQASHVRAAAFASPRPRFFAPEV
jgi:hypothetical protein